MIDVQQRGRAAAELLRNDTLIEAMDEIAEDVFAQFLSTGVSTPETRESVWAIGQALQCLKQKLDAYIDNGKMEALRSTQQ